MIIEFLKVLSCLVRTQDCVSSETWWLSQDPLKTPQSCFQRLNNHILWPSYKSPIWKVLDPVCIKWWEPAGCYNQYICRLMVRDCHEWDRTQILRMSVPTCSEILVPSHRLDVAGLKASCFFRGPQICNNKIVKKFLRIQLHWLILCSQG